VIVILLVKVNLVGQRKMRSLLTLSFLTLSLIVAGCKVPAKQVAASFAEVRIESHPKGWGYAHKTVKRDGTIIGGHMSGSPNTPRVYETKSHMTKEDMKALHSLVAKVHGERITKESISPKDGYVCVVISYEDGTSVTISAKWEQKFGSANVQAIWDLLYKYEVGAW
jgi:hypothetical protein